MAGQSGCTKVLEIAVALAGLTEQAELVRLLANDAGLFASARNSLNQIVGPIGAICRLPDAELVPTSGQARAAGAARFNAMRDAPMADPDAPLP